MRVCSTNSILIGIAFHDLIVFVVIIYDQVIELWFPTSEENCFDYTHIIAWINDLQRDILEQTSYWLGVLLALFRLLIMRLPGTNSTLSRPQTGYVTVLAVTVIGALVSCYFHHTICSYVSRKDCYLPPIDMLEVLATFQFLTGLSEV
uniref:G_PROTEIN_RECEP_F1_2 domain-containing protein n=1 Tax=Caenorhabditis tropicalis TaxID=1561998 RepID=A0A1I7V2H7_9PELO